ncbi:hypothetical protein PAXRUDRAFT_16927 [Paxillus rubicundulus Ve08.2h10]|uniref:Unplaced genomic scaffold scaffold_1804, whole genome shotgun sequence n=1 Tax=Paxillus rubicundulus Ve08.2h10 TaxID=930991 RepID=A0A0D0C5B0_9AGAM|nr:hypothetical protein PAXRUDRAFT_16927 [Paxillus rubicundulus Ve08.2h10]
MQVIDGGPILNGTVLKRSHSDCGKFVFLPPEAVKGDGREAEKEREYRQGLRNWEVLCESMHTEDETWFQGNGGLLGQEAHISIPIASGDLGEVGPLQHHASDYRPHGQSQP